MDESARRDADNPASPVIPAKAGISLLFSQLFEFPATAKAKRDSRFRGSDGACTTTSPIDLFAQIPPLRIRRLDQLDLPFPLPGLELLLAPNRVVDRVVRLGEHEPCEIVVPAEARALALAVLRHALTR